MYTYTSSTGLFTVVYRYVDFHGFVGTAHIRTGICACTRTRPSTGIGAGKYTHDVLLEA